MGYSVAYTKLDNQASVNQFPQVNVSAPTTYTAVNNALFKADVTGKVLSYKITILDITGRVVYISANPLEGWDGKNHAEDMYIAVISASFFAQTDSLIFTHSATKKFLLKKEDACALSFASNTETTSPSLTFTVLNALAKTDVGSKTVRWLYKTNNSQICDRSNF